MNFTTKELRKIILESLENDPASTMELKMKWRSEDMQSTLAEMKSLYSEMCSPETSRISKSYYAKRVGTIYEKIKKSLETSNKKGKNKNGKSSNRNKKNSN